VEAKVALLPVLVVQVGLVEELVDIKLPAVQEEQALLDKVTQAVQLAL
jgi:hypothetical protein